MSEIKIPEGYKQTEVGIIPEDWEVFNFGSLINYIKGCPFKSADYQHTGVRIIRVSDTSFTEIKDNNPIYISDGKAKTYKPWKLQKDDLIISTVGSKPPMYDSLVGKVIKVTSKHDGSLLNQNALRVRAKSDTNGIQSLLLGHFRTERYIDFIERIYRGNANQASITLQSLFEFKIPLPSSKKEQTAIATALSDVDNLIQSLDKLIAKKEAIKIGTMQQLLTGKTRLPEFATRNDGSKKELKQTELGRIPEDWEVTSIKDITRNIIDYRGVTPRKLGMQWGNGNIIALSAGNVKRGYIDFQSECYLGSEALYDRWMTSGDTEKDDLVFTLEAPLGNVALILDNRKYIMSQRTILLQLNRSKYEPKLIYQIFLSESFMNYISSSATGSTAKGIKRKTFEKLKLIIPVKLEEQTAVASILSDMDAEIQALQERLEKIRDIKQGMMQQLLTGKVRLAH